MQKFKNKTMAILIAIFLTISMSASIILIPNATAHSPPWTYISWAYLTVAPNPVGIGQQVGVYMWVDHAMPGASQSLQSAGVGGETSGISNGIRRMGYQLTITAPDGTVSKQTWAVVSDSTGIQMYYFTADQLGTYTFSFYYPGQVYTWTSTTSGATTADTNDTFLPATSRTLTLTVTQQPALSNANPQLPTAFWTYPIFGINWNWFSIASNWLSGPFTPAFGSHSGSYQPDGPAPNTPHVMWTNPIQFGGVVGGNETGGIPGESYYQGGSYNTRFSNAIIMQGMLFFQLPFGESGSGGAFVAWDLKTGTQLWSINTSATGVSLVPSFGYIPSMDQPNQHGPLPDGALVATTSQTGLGTVWRFYDPMTGVLTPMNVTNVPGGTAVAGPNNEYLKILLTNYGNASNPNYYLSEWNSTKVFGYYSGTGTAGWYTGTENASNPIAYDWNVSVTLPQTADEGGWSIAANCISYGNILLLSQGSFDSMSAYFTPKPGPINMTGVSLQPQNLGKALWTQTYPIIENNSGVLGAWDPGAGIFNLWFQDSMTQYGYSLSTGSLVWGPEAVPNSTNTDFNYIGDATTQEQAQYGNLYWAGYAGALYCFNEATGALTWTYGNGNTADNSTNVGTGTPYGTTTEFISAIADGKIYLSSTEHSPNQPLYPTYGERCINATTGLQIWYIPCYGNLMYSAITPIASGYMVADNTFSQEIYCFGQGPSALTVTAPDTATSVGTPVVIRGTVLDISAGTQQTQQKADFPYGVPAVSDDSQSAWMQYVYEQQPMPYNATGVPVTLSVLDSNGNFRQIGTTTSDASGMFTFAWAPDISGSYTVVANFAGSNAYYPSSAETSFYATAAPATPSPYPVTTLPPTEMYVAAAAIAIIIALAIVGAVIVMMLKKP